MSRVYACVEYETTERIFMEFGIEINAKVFWEKLIWLGSV
jgi:hypothetical protein